jgi:hypothetical protein
MHRHNAEGVAFAKRQCSEVGLTRIVAFAKMVSNKWLRSPCDPLSRRRTSDVAMRCLRSSVSSRVRRASCALTWGEAELSALSDALLRFRFVALRLRDLARSPLTLERRFIAFPVG